MRNLLFYRRWKFYVFSDGQFDFNARSSVRDKSLNQTREGMEIKTAVVLLFVDNYSVKVEYDRWGNVARMEMSQSILIQMIE
jgi:hypothetical protein